MCEFDITCFHKLLPYRIVIRIDTINYGRGYNGTRNIEMKYIWDYSSSAEIWKTLSNELENLMSPKSLYIYAKQNRNNSLDDLYIQKEIHPQIESRPVLLTTEAATIPSPTSHSIKIQYHLHHLIGSRSVLLTTEAATIPSPTSHSIKIQSHLHHLIGSRPVLRTTEAATIPRPSSYSIKIQSHLHHLIGSKPVLRTTEAATIPHRVRASSADTIGPINVLFNVDGIKYFY
ncbi:unnamed protein product [Gordionus sp. m RMFG-2023]